MNNPIKTEIHKITIPDDIRSRTVWGIKVAKEEFEEEKSKSKVKNSKIKIVVAIILAAMTVSGIDSNYTTLAQMINGYFKDMINWKGAVVGLKYHDATNEILIKANEVNMDTNFISVPMEVEFLIEEVAPYSTTELLTVGEYRVITNSGKEISPDDITIKPKKKQSYNFQVLDKDKLLSQKYTIGTKGKIFEGNLILDNQLLESEDSIIIKIQSFYSQAIGEAPLEITGNWIVEIPLSK